MARLPTSIEQPGPRGATGRGTAVDFGGLDNALQGVAREVQRFDQARKQADDEEAGRLLAEAEATYSAGAIERWAADDGRELGRDAAEVERWRQESAPLLARPDLSDGVRDSLNRLHRDATVRIGGQAAATAARTRAERSAANRDAANQSAANRAWDDFLTEWAPQQKALQDEWDGGDLLTPLTSTYDALTAPLLDGQPPEIVERLRGRIEAERTRVVMNALHGQEEARGAVIARNAGQSVNALVNRIAADPSVLNRFDEEMAPILATLPALARQPFRDRAWQEAASRGLESRIQGGDFEAVRAEIADGRWNGLDAGTVAGLNRAVETADAIRTIEDARAEQDLAAEIDAGVRDILNGGRADPSLVARALEIGGPDLAATVERDQKAAARIVPLMGRLRTMTPEAAQAELERLTAEAVDATGARVLELGTQMIARDRELRADPAAWAATAVGPGDRIAADVQGRWRAFVEGPTAETAQAYARATWTAQTAGGVAEQSIRILDRATAEGWIAALDAEDGVAASGLADLGRRAALFGPRFQAQVLRELGLAGLRPADLGAMTHYASSPRRLELYARGRALTNETRPDKAARDEIDAALTRDMADYMRTLGSRRGGQGSIEAARTLAYGMVARGESVRDAVRTATAPMNDGYTFIDTYAVPVRSGVDVQSVRLGASALAEGLSRDGLAPTSSLYSTDQSRRVYADQVRETAAWRTLADDSGLELVMPNARNEVVRVKGADGRDMVRTWAELTAAAAPARARLRATGGGF